MSGDLSSSNPFRRAQPAGILPDDALSAQERFPPLPQGISSEIGKAHDASPPVSPPMDKFNTSDTGPTPVPYGTSHETSSLVSQGTLRDTNKAAATDPFGSDLDSESDEDLGNAARESTSVEGSGKQQPASVPKNPFQKTLATMQGTDYESMGDTEKQLSRPSITGNSRPSLDVDGFKRLLMTGNANAPTHGTPATPQHQQSRNAHQGIVGDSSSNTDSSSISRQSIFEPVPETALDSPRTSHEIYPSDGERQRLVRDTSSGSKKAKPAPPKTRHGKPIRSNVPQTVSFTDPSLSWSSFEKSSTPTKPIRSESSTSLRTPTDLNKPLPPPPVPSPPRLPAENAVPSPDTRTPPTEPLPSSTSQSRRPPPTPSRRQSYMKTSQTSIPRTDSGSFVSQVEDSVPDEHSASHASSKPSTPAGKAPPPPPSRRTGGGHARTVSDFPSSSPAASASAISLGGPRPLRSLSGSKPLGAVPPPVPPSRTHSSSSRRARRSSASSASSAAPPPPPPPPRIGGSGRSSLDAPIPLSASPASADIRNAGQENGRRPSAASFGNVETLERKGNSGEVDILADLTALQREVDELRGRYATRSASG